MKEYQSSLVLVKLIVLKSDIDFSDIGCSVLDLVLLKSFVAVARAGSISVAAVQVGRTQSALSMQMQRLADQIGLDLLQRTGAGVRLTAMGERMLAHAEQLIARHDEILADMTGDTVEGSISLGFPEDYSIAFLPQLLKGFCATYPKVKFRIVCAPTTDLRPLLQRNQIDMALVSNSDSDHIAVIRKEDFVWVAASADVVVFNDEFVTLALSAPSTLDHQAACAALDAEKLRYRIAFASNSLAGLIAITRSRHAISVMTRAAVPKDLQIITNIIPKLPTIGITIEHSGPQPSAIAKHLEDHIKAVLPSLRSN